ncbi:MAG: PTS sugar transporter subunit IIA [Erysipelotrichaceae bacterium]
MFDKKITLFNQDVASQDEALKILADEFLKAGVVNDKFYEGIKQREIIYPTGLLLENGMGVAIPHTDGDKVVRSQIGFMSLSTPVIFKEMGQDDNPIEVSMIFMLALKEAHEQLETLSNLMNLFQNSEVMERLVNCSSVLEYDEIIKSSGLE